MHLTYGKLVAIGGNMPIGSSNVGEILQSAVAEVQKNAGQILKMSGWYRTPAFPPNSGPDFINAAFLVKSSLEAEAFLQVLHGVEAQFGRERTTRWGARSVDLDLIADGDTVLPDVETWRFWAGLSPDEQQRKAPDRLILPHPRMQGRSFVLVPLMDICPDWRHPVLGLTVAQMHANLSVQDRDSAVRL